MKFNVNNIYQRGGFGIADDARKQLAGLKNKNYNSMFFPGVGNRGSSLMTMDGMTDPIAYYGLDNSGRMIDQGIAKPGDGNFTVKGDNVYEERLKLPKGKKKKKSKFSIKGMPKFNIKDLDGGIKSVKGFKGSAKYNLNPTTQFNTKFSSEFGKPSKTSFQFGVNKKFQKGGFDNDYLDDEARATIDAVRYAEESTKANIGRGATQGVSSNTGGNYDKDFMDEAALSEIANKTRYNTGQIKPIRVSKIGDGTSIYSSREIDPIKATSVENKEVDELSKQVVKNVEARGAEQATDDNDNTSNNTPYSSTDYNKFTRGKLDYGTSLFDKMGQSRGPSTSSNLSTTKGVHRRGKVDNMVGGIKGSLDRMVQGVERKASERRDRQETRRQRLKDEIDEMRVLKTRIKDTSHQKGTDRIERAKKLKNNRLQNRLLGAQEDRAAAESYEETKHQQKLKRDDNYYRGRRDKNYRQYTEAEDNLRNGGYPKYQTGGHSYKNLYNKADPKAAIISPGDSEYISQEQYTKMMTEKEQQRQLLNPNSPSFNYDRWRAVGSPEYKMTPAEKKSEAEKYTAEFATFKRNGGYPKAQIGRFTNPNMSSQSADFQGQSYNTPTYRANMNEDPSAAMWENSASRMANQASGLPEETTMLGGQQMVDPRFSVQMNRGLQGGQGATDNVSSASVPGEESKGSGALGSRSRAAMIAGMGLPIAYNMIQSAIPAEKVKRQDNPYSNEIYSKLATQRVQPDYRRVDSMTVATDKNLRNTSNNPAAVAANRLANVNNKGRLMGELALKADKGNQDLATRALMYKDKMGQAKAGESKRVDALETQNKLQKQKFMDLAMSQGSQLGVKLSELFAEEDMSKFQWETMGQIYDQFGLAAFDDVASGKIAIKDMVNFRQKNPEEFNRVYSKLKNIS